MNITVFGGSKLEPGSPDYVSAQKLGKLLAEAGHSVLTGGYMGSMQAVSQGAFEAGGHVIGITCVEIERWRTAKANPWVKEERKLETLQQRLDALIRGCDAAIALPGGPGTLTEISLMWNLIIVEALPAKPLILIGSGWQAMLRNAFDQMGTYFSENQRALLKFAPDVETAARFLS